MATRVPLPRYDALPERVLFHREHPADPYVILQIPTHDGTDSETHKLDLELPADAGWLESMPHSRELRDLLTMEQHVAFDTATGYVEAIPDLDMPTPMQMAVAEARFMSRPQPMLEQFKRAHIAVDRPVAPMSPLRAFLMGPFYRGGMRG